MTWGTMVFIQCHQDIYPYLSHVHSKQGSTQENEDAAVEDDSLQESWLEIPDGSHRNATIPRILLYSSRSGPVVQVQVCSPNQG